MLVWLYMYVFRETDSVLEKKNIIQCKHCNVLEAEQT